MEEIHLKAVCRNGEKRQSPAMTYLQPYRSPLGPMTMAGDGLCLTGLWFDGQKYFPDLTACTYKWRDLPLFGDVRRWLADYFRGCRPGDTPPLRLTGSPFRQLVWSLLREIPYGQTVTYRDMARELARRRNDGRAVAAQAVGGAVGHNPVCIIVPCHRVVGHGGCLTGYAGGLGRKAALLRTEGTELHQDAKHLSRSSRPAGHGSGGLFGPDNAAG